MVRQYARQRPVHMWPITSRVVDRETGEVHYRVARTQFPGDVVVELGSTRAALEASARKLGVELKEAHLRDDVIESVIHESLHLSLSDNFIRQWSKVAEERFVESITKEVMEDIRELPPLESGFVSTEVQARKQVGMLVEVP